MEHTEIMHHIALATESLTKNGTGCIEPESTLHKALIALCEEESAKEHFVKLQPFPAETGPRTPAPTETGPFTARTEAERTLRGAMATGRFASGTIVAREKTS